MASESCQKIGRRTWRSVNFEQNIRGPNKGGSRIVYGQFFVNFRLPWELYSFVEHTRHLLMRRNRKNPNLNYGVPISRNRGRNLKIEISKSHRPFLSWKCYENDDFWCKMMNFDEKSWQFWTFLVKIMKKCATTFPSLCTTKLNFLPGPEKEKLP